MKGKNMRKSDFWFFIVSWAIVEDEKRKREEMHRQRQENKNVSRRIRKQNVSKGLGQHKYMYLSKRSR